MNKWYCTAFVTSQMTLSPEVTEYIYRNTDVRDQRPCITRRWTHAVLRLGWLNIFWKSSEGGSCKECAVPPAYAQSCPAVIWGVLQLWRRRITMKCTLSTASIELSISVPRQTSRDPYFSLLGTVELERKSWFSWLLPSPGVLNITTTTSVAMHV